MLYDKDRNREEKAMKRDMTPDEIKALRKRARMSQEEFATAIGATARSVSRWETGEIVPGRMAQLAMAHFEQELEYAPAASQDGPGQA
jgi:DNA-binding transcriptional regulator YiaG